MLNTLSNLITNSNELKVKYTTEGILFNGITFDTFFSIDNQKIKINDVDIVKIVYEKSNSLKEIKFDKIKRLYFKDCKFDFIPTISNNNIWLLNFENCDFNESGSFMFDLLSIDKKSKKVYFNNCTFDSFTIGDITDIKYNLNKNLCYFEINGGSIQDCIIQNIEIVTKFYINKQYDNNSEKLTIKKLTIKNTIFKENFKLHNTKVEKFQIHDTDFEKHADFFKSKFIQGIENNILFYAINFRKLALFGDTYFEQKLIFRYVTFEGFVHFRRAQLHKGIDLDYTNIQNEINFYGINISDNSYLSQETCRIIKYQLDKIGNKIESNKFHSLELSKNRKNIWSQNNISLDLFQRGVVAFLHFLTSNHSQSWVLPLGWIMIVGILTDSALNDNNLIGYDEYTNQTIQYMSLLTQKDMFYEPLADYKKQPTI